MQAVRLQIEDWPDAKLRITALWSRLCCLEIRADTGGRPCTECSKVLLALSRLLQFIDRPEAHEATGRL